MKKRSKRKRKVNGRSTVTKSLHQHHRYISNGLDKTFSEWDETVKKAEQGELTEEERAAVAVKASMLEAQHAFIEALVSKNLDRFNTNLGLVLETVNTIAGSVVVYGVGEGGTNMFSPLVLTVAIGEIQDVDEHITFLTTDAWKELTDKLKSRLKERELSLSIYKDQKPMVVIDPHQAGIR